MLAPEVEKCIRSNYVACWEYQVKVLLNFDYRIPEAAAAMMKELDEQQQDAPIAITATILDKLKSVSVIDQDFTLGLVGEYYKRGDEFLAAWNVRNFKICEDLVNAKPSSLPKTRPELDF